VKLHAQMIHAYNEVQTATVSAPTMSVEQIRIENCKCFSFIDNFFSTLVIQFLIVRDMNSPKDLVKIIIQ
jgi:hypothetical protein